MVVRGKIQAGVQKKAETSLSLMQRWREWPPLQIPVPIVIHIYSCHILLFLLSNVRDSSFKTQQA